MANNCFYDMRVAGKKETVESVIEFVKNHSYDGCDVYDENESSTEYEKDVFINGDVKWSVMTAWNTDKYYDQSRTSFAITTSKGEKVAGVTDTELQERIMRAEEERRKGPSILDFKDDINIEIYSEESGMGFAEHFIIKNGEIVVDDTRHFSEIYNEENDTIIRKGGYAVYDFDFNPDKEIPTYNNYIER